MVQYSFGLSSTGITTDNDLAIVERFVVLLYNSTSSCTDVNACRRYLFTKKGRVVESIPPTKDSLMQHVKRTLLQWKQVINVS